MQKMLNSLLNTPAAARRAFTGFRALLLAAAVASCCGASVHADPTPADGKYHVTCSVVGPDSLPTDTSAGPGFAEALAARPGFSIQGGISPGSGVWLPPGKAPGALPISLVSVSFGKHRDLLAFIADEKGTTMLASVRRECTVGRKTRRDWAGPGQTQLPENAARELAQDFAHLQTSALKVDPARQVFISVIPWKTVSTDLAGGFAEPPPAGAKSTASIPMEPSGGASLQAVNALAIAAMTKAGAQPTSQQSPTTLTIEAAQNIDHYALRFTLKRAGRSDQFIHRSIPQPDVFDHIAIASQKLWVWGDDVRSAAKVGEGAAEPLAHGNGTVAIGVGGAIRGIDPVSGRDLWPAIPARRPAFPYALASAPKSDKLIRMGKPSDFVDIQSGKLTPAAPDAPASPWGFNIAANGHVAVVTDLSVSFCDGTSDHWKVTFTDPITAGPGISDKAVFIGNEAGDITALSIADGKELWRKPTGLRLTGPATVMGDTLIVCGFDGTILALSASDSKELWRHQAKDILLTRPVLVDGMLLLADKGNTIWLLDPNTGGPKATYQTPTWLISAVLIESAPEKWVVVCDLEGTVRFLSLPTLKPAREVPLSCQLSKQILLVPQLPSAWASGNDIDIKSPGLLLGDRHGWLYLLNLPGK